MQRRAHCGQRVQCCMWQGGVLRATSILNFCFEMRIAASIPSTLYISRMGDGKGGREQAIAEVSRRKAAKGRLGSRVLQAHIPLEVLAQPCDEVFRGSIARCALLRRHLVRLRFQARAMRGVRYTVRAFSTSRRENPGQARFAISAHTEGRTAEKQGERTCHRSSSSVTKTLITTP